MELQELKNAIAGHSGQFHCRQTNHHEKRKDVAFKHIYESPRAHNEVPNVGKLKEFYCTFSELSLYYDEVSGDCAIHIADTAEWDSLAIHFTDWLESLNDEERTELLPDWLSDYVVIGEAPGSGNYYLIPTKGERAGYVYEFEHDGFDFLEIAKDIEDFIAKALNLDGAGLINIAAHMRFVEYEDYSTQWWIVEMTDSLGRVVTTETK